MIKQITFAVSLCCGFNSFADCFDELDPHNTIRNNTITLDDAKRNCNYILNNIQYDKDADDDDCIKSTDEKCMKIAYSIVYKYLKEHYEIPKRDFIIPNEDFHILFYVHTFSKNSNLTPTLDSYKSFLNYIIGLYESSSSKLQSQNMKNIANQSGRHLERIRQWKAAGKLDSIAKVGYNYSLRTTNSEQMNMYCDSLFVSYEEEAPKKLDIQITDDEFKSVTKDLRMKLVKCFVFSSYCNEKGIKNNDVHLAEEFLSKWKKIHTDRFGEILLKGDKKFYISNHLVRYSLTNCGDEMVFNDYYNMMEDILIKNEHDDAFKVYARMYQDGTLYDFLRNKYLSLRASH